MQELIHEYIQDASEMLESLEGKLFVLENDYKNMEIIHDVFRVMHNLKGSAGMYGFDNVQTLTHDLETVYDKIRNNKMDVDKEILNCTFQSSDILKDLLKNSDTINDQTAYNNLLNRISTLIGSTTPIKEEVKPEVKNSSAGIVAYIRFTPDQYIFNRGVNLVSLFEEIKELGQTVLIAENDEIPLEKQQYELRECSTAWDILVSTTLDIAAVKDIFIFIDDSEYIIKQLETDDYISEIKAINETINDKALIAFSEFTNASTQKEEKKAKTEQATTTSKAEESIRVSSKKLDVLMNLVSELVINKSQLELLALKSGNPSLVKAVEHLSKLTKQFRDNALEIRLIPIESIMVNFRRLVRDLSQTLNKEIAFVVEGGDTELDKNIISALEKPLMHIIRNAADHGIEDLATRKMRGKTPEGMIKFIAFYSGANVFIQIQDDGGGLDLNRIKQKAIEKGIITEQTQLADKDIINLIFEPGFSTASVVSDVSGRGVGMDVVKKQLEELRGEIEITTELALGTSFTLKLPLTLSIIDTLHVRVKGIELLVPLSNVDYCDKISHEELKALSRNALQMNGSLIPLINLRQMFHFADEQPEFQKLVVVHREEKQFAILTDEVVGEHQAVLKPLGEVFKDQEYLSGASIMGDGKVSLVLDINKLVQSALSLQ